MVRSKLAGLGLVSRIAPCSRVSGNVLSGGLGGWWLSKIIQCRITSLLYSSLGTRPTAACFGQELVLLAGVAAGESPPARRGDQTGETDGLGIDRGKQQRGAVGDGLVAGRDQLVDPASPLLPGAGGLASTVVPEVTADQEPGQDRIEHGCRAVLYQQSAVLVLGAHDLFADLAVGPEWGGRFAGIRRPDPVPVSGADVAVVRQQPLQRAAVVAGVATWTTRLRLVPPRGPVRGRVT
jgi:hypothetical protein